MASVATSFRVLTRWDGRLWMVRVEDDNGYDRGEITARRLEQIDSKVRALLDTTTTDGCGCGGPVELMVQVHLHPDVELRFQLAADLVAGASREIDGIVAALLGANMAPQDIAVLLASRTLTAQPRRPLVVANAEIAAVGLDCHPDALAVRWEDRGFGMSTYCRNCLDDDPSPWHDLPHATSALIYHGPVRCDGCNHDITAAAPDVREMAADR
jgi:hypothetical protein